VALIGVYFGKRCLSGGYISYRYETSLKRNVLNTLKHFLRIILILSVTIFTVTLLLDIGLGRMLGLNANTSQLAIIISGISSKIAGFGTAGLLLMRGEVDEKTVAISLMVAFVFHRIVGCLRFSMPVNVSLFGPSLGIKLTAVLLLVGELVCIFNIVFLFFLIFLGII